MHRCAFRLAVFFALTLTLLSTYVSAQESGVVSEPIASHADWLPASVQQRIH